MTPSRAVAHAIVAIGLFPAAWAADALWVDPDKTEPAGASYRTFHSKTIAQDVSYLIYLPADYQAAPQKRFPVVYWLHGLGGNQRGGATFVGQLDAAIKAQKTPAMIAVLVNGLRDSRYYNSFDGLRPVESVIIKDLIPHVDETYRTIARRESRAIEGYSMGGFGAARLGFKYPELFGAVSIMAGALLDTESAATTMHSELFEKNFGGSKAYFHAGSPWVLPEQNLDKIRSRVFVRIGVGDRDGLFERNLTYHEMLDRLGVANAFFAVPGVAHNQRLFYEKLGADAFAFYREAFSGKTAYQFEIEQWRREREERLKAEGGWLSVAGLFWLKEGANRFGADPSNEIVLSAGSAPARAGVFEFHSGRTVLRVENGAKVTLDGRPVAMLEMHPDTAGAPEVIALGDLTMHVIERNGRFAIRLKDNNSKFRREFAGLRWFPIKPEYRLVAKFVAYDPPKTLAIPTVLGDVEQLPSPGYVAFTLNDREYRLDPVVDEDELFFIFRDLTSGKGTYGAGRFLNAEPPRAGAVILDFNKSYSPPCAFTPFATCPLPPRQNSLPLRIEAGELSSGH